MRETDNEGASYVCDCVSGEVCQGLCNAMADFGQLSMYSNLSRSNWEIPAVRFVIRYKTIIKKIKLLIYNVAVF